MTGTSVRRQIAWGGLVALALTAAGCQVGARGRIEECRNLTQALRAENAQLKDQVLALRSQNQDLSERSVDDVRRLAQLEEANRRLESSVQAYQDERARLETAYKELRASLPGSLQPLGLSREDQEVQPSSRESETDDTSEPATGGASAGRTEGWIPSRRGDPGRPISARGNP